VFPVYVVLHFVPSARPSLLSNTFCGLLRMHVELILIFQPDFVSGYIFALNTYLRTSKGLFVSTMCELRGD
jgi:hypothetical protein